MVKIFAHRGGMITSPPGNTVLAFKKAIELGADGFECDLRLTKDKEPIIHHSPKLSKLLWQDIKKEDPNIPHLFDLLDFLKEKVSFITGV